MFLLTCDKNDDDDDDYCNAVLAESPKAISDKLQRVLNAAARVVTETRKYDRGLTDILRNELHLLSVPQRVKFKLGTMMFRCLRQLSSAVPVRPVANVAAHSQLRSARRHLVVVPRYNRSTYGRRAFSVAGPMTWNSLTVTDSLHDPSLSIDSFRRQLKTFLLGMCGMDFFKFGSVLRKTAGSDRFRFGFEKSSVRFSL